MGKGLLGHSIGATIKPPLPQLGKPHRSKNALQPSKEQPESSGVETTTTNPFSSVYSDSTYYSTVYSTAGTIALEQAEEDYRQVLYKISSSKKNAIIIGKKNTDIAQGNNSGADDVDIVAGTPGSSSYYSDDD